MEGFLGSVGLVVCLSVMYMVFAEESGVSCRVRRATQHLLDRDVYYRLASPKQVRKVATCIVLSDDAVANAAGISYNCDTQYEAMWETIRDFEKSHDLPDGM